MRPFVHVLALRVRNESMKKRVSLSVCLLVAAAAVVAGFGLHLWVQAAVLPAPVLEEARQQIETKFIGEYDPETLKDAAIKGMVSALGDRWSYYLSADEYSAYEASVNNAYVGIGVTIESDMEKGGLRIRKVQAGGPAQEAGLKAGEQIIAAEGKPFAGLTLAQAKALISGEAGTSVMVTVRSQDGGQRDVTLIRREIVVVPVNHQMLERQIGYIQIQNFDSTASQHAKAAVNNLMEQGAKKLVFDLRNNPGGLLTELLDLLDFLLPEGDTFISVDYTGEERIYHSDESCVDLPISILVNEETYSAAEFFAAIFQEMGRGRVVGTQTSGKGYSQVPIRLSDGSAVVLSTAKYFTPNRVSLIGKGVTPDVALPMTEEQNKALLDEMLSPGEDTQLQKAISD